MTTLALYRGATTLAAPLVRLVLARRLRTGKEDPHRYAERFGAPGLPRPDGPLAWIHAASVGEALSALALIERLVVERPALALLVTTGTVTSAQLMAERLPARVLHQYAPFDRPPWIRRFLDHWRPGLALWMESEFWPNMLGEARARSIPLVLVNARISARSYDGWRHFPGTIRQLLNGFDLCLPQSETDRDRLTVLGAPHIGPPGNLKFAAAALPVDPAALAALQTALGSRPWGVFAHTHPGEDEVMASAHRILKARVPDLVTLIVPRHPARGPRIAQMLSDTGMDIALRSAGDRPTETTDIYVADTVGELGLFYRLAPIAFVGGSLIAHGGQNLLEPAKLGCTILHGPHMANFAAIVTEMREAGATEMVSDAPAMAAAVGRLLADDRLRAQRSAAAAGVARRKADILDAVTESLAPWLDRLTPRGRPAASAAAPDPAGAQHARA